MMDVIKLSRRAEEMEKELTELRETITLLENAPYPDFDCELLGEHKRIEIYDLRDLHKARQWMKKVFGKWADQYLHSFGSLGKIYSRWEGENGWGIWLQSNPDAVPPEILNGCYVAMLNKTEYEVVCDIKE